MSGEQMSTQEKDAVLTVDQWAAYSKEELDLKCNRYNVHARGSVVKLAQNLFNFFHPVSHNSGSGRSKSPANQNEDPRVAVNNHPIGDDQLSLGEGEWPPQQGAHNEEYAEASPPSNPDIPLTPGRSPRERVVKSPTYGSEEVSPVKTPPVKTPSGQEEMESSSEESSVRSKRRRRVPPPKRRARHPISPTKSSSVSSRPSRSRSRSPLPKRRSREEGNLMQEILASLQEQKKTIGEYQAKQDVAQAEVRALRSQIQSLTRVRKSPLKPPPKKPTPKKQTAKEKVSPPRRRTKSSTRKKRQTPSPPPISRRSSRKSRGSSKESDHDNKRKRVRSVAVGKKKSKTKGKHSSTSSSPGGNDVQQKMSHPSSSLRFPDSKMASLFAKDSYRLPPIKKELLETIRKREFCCFNKLKPKKLYLKSMEDKKGIDRVDMKYDKVLGTLKLSKRKSDTVQNFPEWMEVWNIFSQAHLHFHPRESQALFEYQKTITRFSSKYTFDAIYSYDIDFRYLLSAERHLPPAERQAFWGRENEELVNVHLRDQRKPEPSCFLCKEKGHYANKCPSSIGGGRGGNQPQPLMSIPPMPIPPAMGNPGGNRGMNPPSGRRMLPPSSSRSNNPRNNGNRGARNFCHHFRDTGNCPFGARCRFRHDCEQCGQEGHNASTCFMFTNTPFRPQS